MPERNSTACLCTSPPAPTSTPPTTTPAAAAPGNCARGCASRGGARPPGSSGILLVAERLALPHRLDRKAETVMGAVPSRPRATIPYITGREGEVDESFLAIRASFSSAGSNHISRVDERWKNRDAQGVLWARVS